MTESEPSDRLRRRKPGNAKADDASGGVRRAGVLLLGIGGAILLGFLVLRFSAVNALLQVGPEAAAMISPHHPDAILERASDETRSGDPAEATERAALAAFRKAPLSEVPLLIRAQRFLARGDWSRADRLISTVIRRNPRSRQALLLRLSLDVQHERLDETASTMAVLARLMPNANEVLTGELARMAMQASTRTGVARVMATDAQLRERVLEQLARRGADPEIVFSLAGPPTQDQTGEETPRWQQLLLNGLVERGEVARALQVWLRITGQPPASRGGGVYDPDFAGLPGPAPFNWNLETSADGLAERVAGSGLQVEYYGRDAARLASQLMTLPPGRYELNFEAEGQTEEDGGRLSWVLACHPGDRRLGEIPLAGVDYSPRRISGAFEVPGSGCPGQWLRLVGLPGEFPKDQQVTIGQMRLMVVELR